MWANGSTMVRAGASRSKPWPAPLWVIAADQGARGGRQAGQQLVEPVRVVVGVGVAGLDQDRRAGELVEREARHVLVGPADRVERGVGDDRRGARRRADRASARVAVSSETTPPQEKPRMPIRAGSISGWRAMKRRRPRRRRAGSRARTGAGRRAALDAPRRPHVDLEGRDPGRVQRLRRGTRRAPSTPSEPWQIRTAGAGGPSTRRATACRRRSAADRRRWRSAA